MYTIFYKIWQNLENFKNFPETFWNFPLNFKTFHKFLEFYRKFLVFSNSAEKYDGGIFSCFIERPYDQILSDGVGA